MVLFNTWYYDERVTVLLVKGSLLSMSTTILWVHPEVFLNSIVSITLNQFGCPITPSIATQIETRQS